MSTRDTVFVHRFSSRHTCKLTVMPPWPSSKRLTLMTQERGAEVWYDKAGKLEPDIGDFLGNRTEELPEHQDIFHEYRDWIVSVIMPALVEKWELPVTVHITGWRPHQHQTWDCELGQNPVQRPSRTDGGESPTRRSSETREDDDQGPTSRNP
jgi:hypothetical protein